MKAMLQAISKLLDDRPGQPPRQRANRFFFMLTLLVDMLMIANGIGLAVMMRESISMAGLARSAHQGFIYTHFPIVLCYYLAGLYVAFKYVDVYRERRFLTGNREAGRIIKAIFVFTLGNMLLGFLLPTQILFSRLTLGISWVLITVFVLVGRWMVSLLRETLREKGMDITVALIVGTNPVARQLALELVNTTRHGYRLAGMLQSGEGTKARVDGIRILGGIDRLERVVSRMRVDEVFLCEPRYDAYQITAIFTRLRAHQPRIRVCSNIFNVVIDRVGVPVDAIGTTPILDFAGHEICGWRRFAKRMIDLTCGILFFLLSLPVSLFIAAAIYLESGRPIFFCQTRVGTGNRPFTFYKFRSMVNNAQSFQEDLHAQNEIDGPMFKIREDPRITRVGRFLRKYSLDELPQIWNVVRGDMSLVGPRPPLPAEVEQYEDWHLQRLQGPVGLSGLWQVSGRNELDFEDMALLDIYYLRNHSMFLDYRILIKTIFTVLLGQGR